MGATKATFTIPLNGTNKAECTAQQSGASAWVVSVKFSASGYGKRDALVELLKSTMALTEELQEMINR